MCGILGYSCSVSPSKEFLDKFSKLFVLTESRGNQASGLAWASENKIWWTKEPLSAEEYIKTKPYKQFLAEAPLLAIAHTRYATHGDIKTRANNHPHISAKHSLALVHNGVLYQHEELVSKHSLTMTGQCDSEVLIRLIDKFVGNKLTRKSVSEAMGKAMREVRGSASIALLSPDGIYLSRRTNPLCVAYVEKYDAIVFASEQDDIEAVFGDCLYYRMDDGMSRFIRWTNCEKLDIKNDSPAYQPYVFNSDTDWEKTPWGYRWKGAKVVNGMVETPGDSQDLNSDIPRDWETEQMGYNIWPID